MAPARTLSVSPRLELFFALAAVLTGDRAVGRGEDVNRWLDQARRRLDRGLRRRFAGRASAAFWCRMAALPLSSVAALSGDAEGVIDALAGLSPERFRPADDPEALQLLVVDTLRRFDRLAFAAYWRSWREELAADVHRIEARLRDLPIDSANLTSAIFVPSRFAPPGFAAALLEGDASVLAFDPDRLPALRAPASGFSPAVAPTPRDPALIFRALGDATRYTIAGMIAREPMTSAELARRLDISKPTMAHHLRLLRAAGLVVEESQGRRIVLTLDHPVLEALSGAVLAQFFGGPVAVPIRRSRRSPTSRASAERARHR